MGQRVVALTLGDPELKLTAALESPGNPALGKDAGELCGTGRCDVTVAAELVGTVDVLVDFSTPEGVDSVLSVCEERLVPLVLATTGLTTEQRQRVLNVAQSIPLVMAPSMSTAVNVVMKLAADAARVLKNAAGGCDVEIIERHHRFKEDAPSGTALHFGRLIAEQMGQTAHIHGRQGRPGQRPHDEIGYHALRTGDNVGEHTIVFGLMGETIDLTVRGHTRDSYAYGALTAAKFVAGRAAGLYSMADVLGL